MTLLGREPDEEYTTGLEVGQAKEAVEQIWSQYIEENDLDYMENIKEEFHATLTPNDDHDQYQFALDGRKLYLQFTKQEEGGTNVELYRNTGFTQKNILEPEKNQRDEFLQHLTDTWL